MLGFREKAHQYQDYNIIEMLLTSNKHPDASTRAPLIKLEVHHVNTHTAQTSHFLLSLKTALIIHCMQSPIILIQITDIVFIQVHYLIKHNKNKVYRFIPKTLVY